MHAPLNAWSEILPRAFSFRSDAKFDAKNNFFQCSFRPQSIHRSPEVVLARVAPAQRRSLVCTPKRIKVRFCLGVRPTPSTQSTNPIAADASQRIVGFSGMRIGGFSYILHMQRMSDCVRKCIHPRFARWLTSCLDGCWLPEHWESIIRDQYPPPGQRIACNCP